MQEVSETTIYTLRTAFIVSQNKPSFRQLEEQYHVSKSTIADIASKEDWELQRSKYQNGILGTAQKKVMAEIAKKRQEKVKKLEKIFDKGADRIIELLDKKEYKINIKELDTVARLIEFEQGNADSRVDHVLKLKKPLNEYSLDELIEMHQKVIEGDFELLEEDEQTESGPEDSNPSWFNEEVSEDD